MNPSTLMKELKSSVTDSQSESLGDGNLTGKVGTALYVAPEMMSAAKRVQYSQVWRQAAR